MVLSWETKEKPFIRVLFRLHGRRRRKRKLSSVIEETLFELLRRSSVTMTMMWQTLKLGSVEEFVFVATFMPFYDNSRNVMSVVLTTAANERGNKPMIFYPFDDCKRHTPKYVHDFVDRFNNTTTYYVLRLVFYTHISLWMNS